MNIHPTAQISEKAKIGENSKVWHFVQVRENAVIGDNCIIGKNVYIDHSVKIGNNVKIQNNVSIYNEAFIEDGVFIAPHVCFTNDKVPRSINPDGSIKSGDDWEALKTSVKRGASIGANSTILPGITIGEWALIGAGSVVTKDVPDHALVYGHPAKIKGFVCKCGNKLEKINEEKNKITMVCNKCEEEYTIDKNIYDGVR